MSEPEKPLTWKEALYQRSQQRILDAIEKHSKELEQLIKKQNTYYRRLFEPALANMKNGLAKELGVPGVRFLEYEQETRAKQPEPETEKLEASSTHADSGNSNGKSATNTENGFHTKAAKQGREHGLSK